MADLVELRMRMVRYEPAYVAKNYKYVLVRSLKDVERPFPLIVRSLAALSRRACTSSGGFSIIWHSYPAAAARFLMKSSILESYEKLVTAIIKTSLPD